MNSTFGIAYETLSRRITMIRWTRIRCGNPVCNPYGKAQGLIAAMAAHAAPHRLSRFFAGQDALVDQPFGKGLYLSPNHRRSDPMAGLNLQEFHIGVGLFLGAGNPNNELGRLLEIDRGLCPTEALRIVAPFRHGAGQRLSHLWAGGD